jgi:hypothetical protein
MARRQPPIRHRSFDEQQCRSKIGIPAKVGTHASEVQQADKWVPAFTGTRNSWSRALPTISGDG